MLWRQVCTDWNWKEETLCSFSSFRPIRSAVCLIWKEINQNWDTLRCSVNTTLLHGAEMCPSTARVTPTTLPLLALHSAARHRVWKCCYRSHVRDAGGVIIVELTYIWLRTGCCLGKETAFQCKLAGHWPTSVHPPAQTNTMQRGWHWTAGWLQPVRALHQNPSLSNSVCQDWTVDTCRVQSGSGLTKRVLAC